METAEGAVGLDGNLSWAWQMCLGGEVSSGKSGVPTGDAQPWQGSPSPCPHRTTFCSLGNRPEMGPWEENHAQASSWPPPSGSPGGLEDAMS